MKLDRTPRIRCALLLAALGVASGATAQSITLRLNLAVGKKHTYTVENKIVQTNKGPGVPPSMASMDMVQRMTGALNVLSKNAKGFVIKNSISSVKVTVPKDSPMAAQVSMIENMIKGASFEATYDARARIVGEPKASSSNPMLKQIMSSMGGMGMGLMGVEFPAGPVSPGSKWTTHFDIGKMLSQMPGMGSAAKVSKIPINFRFVRVENRGGKRFAKLSYTMKGSTSMSAPAASGQQGTIKMGFDFTGNASVDLATGLPVEGGGTGTSTTTFGQMTMTQKTTATFKVQ